MRIRSRTATADDSPIFRRYGRGESNSALLRASRDGIVAPSQAHVRRSSSSPDSGNASILPLPGFQHKKVRSSSAVTRRIRKMPGFAPSIEAALRAICASAVQSECGDRFQGLGRRCGRSGRPKSGTQARRSLGLGPEG
ncbi:hypothetical protein WG70_23360 [Burkholderia oklahomensis EO147]|nr:hypothetical protein WG70_23360 [Burkholderia oklahomensis EO147]KUY68810.1 hypothetical protein WG70_24860 [Burkholderia oklahomensis EO147]